MVPKVCFTENRGARANIAVCRRKTGGDVKPLETKISMWRRGWQRIRGDGGQNVSEYAVLLVLLVLIVVAAVHALGMNAQQVINRVNTALAGG